MSQRLDVITFRQGKDKKYPHRIGSAVRKDDGSISVWLDSLPLADERGSVNLIIQEPRDRGDAPRSRSNAHLDDDMPF